MIFAEIDFYRSFEQLLNIVCNEIHSSQWDMKFHTYGFHSEREASERRVGARSRPRGHRPNADPTPLSRVIECVSGGESDEETPKSLPSQPTRKKRRIGSKSQPTVEERSSEQFLRSLLGRQCTCRRKTCLQQFVAPNLFKKLRDHREYWFSLHKLDQDAAVPWLPLGSKFSR